MPCPPAHVIKQLNNSKTKTPQKKTANCISKCSKVMMIMCLGCIEFGFVVVWFIFVVLPLHDCADRKCLI